MVAPVISISSDSSDESVGSHVPRVILFGTIPTSILVIFVVPAEVPIAPVDPLVAPEVGAIFVISPTGVLDLVDYSSSSNFDPSKDSLPVAPDRPYRTHLNRSRKLLTARKRVGPFPACRLRWRRVSHCSSDRHSLPNFTSDSSSSSSSSDSSSDISLGSSLESLSDSSSVHSSGCNASGQSHSGPSTRVASPRLVDPSVRTPQCSEAFMRWRSAPLSTLYPPTTLESSLDSSSERSLDSSLPFAGPFCKRCKTLATLIPSSTPVSRSIAPALADLPPRKRFRDSYSFEASGEEHMQIGITDAETIADLGISDGVGDHTKDDIGIGVEIATSDVREDEEEFEAKAIAGGMIEVAVDPLAIGSISEPLVPFDRIIEFETAQRQLEAGQLVASEERASLTDRVRSLGRENLRV
ncbi:hypothetical protein Tco_0622364 [Tanacetum coccineum]